MLIYLSMRSEVETDELLRYLLAGSRTVLAPRIDIEKHSLTPYKVRDEQRALRLHSFGMREPDPEICPPFPANQIDLIVVPGLAFDPRGHRIGYGGGFYDRFLPQCRQAVSMGLAYKLQIIEDTAPEGWDVALHQVVTEDGGIIPGRQGSCA